MSKEYDHLYLSPHLDDVALSCGGLIAKQGLGGERVLVLTIFAGRPSYGSLSLFARFLHLTWGNPPDPVGLRWKEDEAALAHLGAEPYHLPLLDALYRGQPRPLYRSNGALFGEIDPQDRGLAEEVAGYVEEVSRRYGQPCLYAPLAVGHHVDHRMVKGAADLLSQRGQEVTYYEDFPYGENPQALAKALAVEEGWSSTLEEIGDALERKIEAIALYSSQIFVLFRSREAMARRVRAYATSLAPERGPAERYWKRA